MKHKWNDFNYWLEHGLPKQDYIICFILGLFSALAMPPVHAFPVLLITFPIFYRLLNKSFTTKQATVKTWLFHLGYFTAGFYWIAHALFVDITHNWWVLPFALFGLPALMAFYSALMIALWHRLAWRGTARLLLFVVMLSLAEWLRGIVFTGFPWNLWGYAWTAFLPVLQSVSIFGIYGLSFFTLLLAMAPLLWLHRFDHLFSHTLLFFTLAVFAILFAWGHGRLQHVFKDADNNFIVRIVQPNIAQTAKWDPQERQRHEEKIWRLTAEKGKITPHLIVWPETALTLFDTWDVRRLENNLQTLLPRGSFLAAGVLDVALNDQTQAQEYFNRISTYDSDGRRLSTYDKSHLVPFGEYLPFQKYWPVKPVAFKEGNFTAGSGVQTVHLPNMPSFSPLICYEVLFSGSTASQKDRPQFILNVTNDAWYGYTSGPFQHLAIAQTRAVEEGLPLIRAANTGISAVIDPLGRFESRLGLGESGVLDQPLPPSLEPTFFARFGNIFFFALLLWFGAIAWVIQAIQTKRIRQLQ